MLTPAQWKVVSPWFNKLRDHRRKKNGHPFVHPDRVILEGVLWILQTRGQMEGFTPSVSALHDRLPTV